MVKIQFSQYKKLVNPVHLIPKIEGIAKKYIIRNFDLGLTINLNISNCVVI